MKSLCDIGLHKYEIFYEDKIKNKYYVKVKYKYICNCCGNIVNRGLYKLLFYEKNNMNKIMLEDVLSFNMDSKVIYIGLDISNEKEIYDNYLKTDKVFFTHKEGLINLNTNELFLQIKY